VGEEIGVAQSDLYEPSRRRSDLPQAVHLLVIDCLRHFSITQSRARNRSDDQDDEGEDSEPGEHSRHGSRPCSIDKRDEASLESAGTCHLDRDRRHSMTGHVVRELE
jgi:hypothetical protein